MFLNVAKAGIEPATYRFSGGRSYQLSYLAVQYATQTGLEPATSAVTGRRANQLRYWALPKYPRRDSNPRYRRERAAS